MSQVRLIDRVRGSGSETSGLFLPFLMGMMCVSVRLRFIACLFLHTSFAKFLTTFLPSFLPSFRSYRHQP